MSNMAKEFDTLNVPSPRYEGTSLRLQVYVVDFLLMISNGACQHCLEAPVQCNAWVPIEGGDRDIVESCTGCLVTVLDATPYLEDTETITVEVARSATVRPF